jgi:hypothetical protein
VVQGGGLKIYVKYLLDGHGELDQVEGIEAHGRELGRLVAVGLQVVLDLGVVPHVLQDDGADLMRGRGEGREDKQGEGE